MLGKILGAEVGRRVAGRNNGVTGALMGAATPWLLRRAFTPIGIAVMGAFALKKLYDMRRDRDPAAQWPGTTAGSGPSAAHPAAQPASPGTQPFTTNA